VEFYEKIMRENLIPVILICICFQISSQGFGKPAPKFTSAFLPPGYFRRINELTLHEEFVRVEDGLALPSVQAAIVRYLGHNHPQRYRARKSLKPKKFNFEFSNVKKRL
jgi:hypothetical protein